MKSFVHKKKNFELNATVYRKPVKLNKERCDVIILALSEDDTGSSVLDRLKSADEKLRNSRKKAVAIIKS